MSDLFNLSDITPGVGVDRISGSASTPSTGDLRRKYNFGDRVSELSLDQDPFFRLVSMVSKKPTDDPNFKFTEKRPSFHKRYAYVVAHGAAASVSTVDATVPASAANDVYYWKMETDYKSDGNYGSIYGNSNGEVTVGASGTTPNFFLQGQLIRINTRATAPSTSDSASSDYIIAKIIDTPTTSGNAKILKTRIIKATGGSNLELCSFKDATNSMNGVGASALTDGVGGPKAGQAALDSKKCYVVGTSFAEGSGYPETWMDQPYTTGDGVTQIWKTSMAMTNTARATQLRYEANEWARVWKEKLIEHKWDIEQDLLFGSRFTDSAGVNHTQGAVDYITNYGNIFNLDHTNKTADDFLDDLSNYFDPRYNNAKSNVFMCDTATYNWLHKLGGYFANNLEVSANFRADLAVTGRKKVLGLDSTTISTVYGDMNVMRNIHLDSSPIKIMGVNMKYCSYRPLVGNGLNRDTSVYVGVQTLENSGVDRRVDLILTEAGMEWQMPECHAYWS